MSPHLETYLQRLLMSDPEGRPISAQACKDAFRAYLTSIGVEFFNYGCFDDQGGNIQSVRYIADARMNMSWKKEYLARGLIDHDLVLNRARYSRGFTQFAFGDWLAPMLDEAEAASVPVLRGAADAGLADGVAVTGALAVDGRDLRWGFALGGASGTGRLIKEQMGEIRIAILALLDRLRPELLRRVDGISAALTPRERDVIAGFAAGDRRDRLAHKLGISKSAVDQYMLGARRKLRAQTASEAVAKAYRYGLL